MRLRRADEQPDGSTSAYPQQKYHDRSAREVAHQSQSDDAFHARYAACAPVVADDGYRAVRYAQDDTGADEHQIVHQCKGRNTRCSDVFHQGDIEQKNDKARRYLREPFGRAIVEQVTERFEGESSVRCGQSGVFSQLPRNHTARHDGTERETDARTETGAESSHAEIRHKDHARYDIQQDGAYHHHHSEAGMPQRFERIIEKELKADAGEPRHKAVYVFCRKR